MTDSLRSSNSRPAAAWIAARAALLVALLCGCSSLAPPPPVDPLEQLPRMATYMPDDADRAARDLAAAIFVGTPEDVDFQVTRIGLIDSERLEQGQGYSGLGPYAELARTATRTDVREFRADLARILKRRDVDETLRTQLEEHVRDDPMQLARSRMIDHHRVRWGRVFNALSEPVGRSIMSLTFLPFRLGNSLLNLALAERQREDLSRHERQALDHWKRFIEAHPESPEAAELVARVEEAQLRWFETQRDLSLKRGRNALEKGDPLLAAAMAERTLRFSPEDGDALELLENATAAGQAYKQSRARSIAVSDDPSVVDPRQRELLLAMLDPGAPMGPPAARLLEALPEGGPLTDEAAFVLAMSQFEEQGSESAGWDALEDVAETDDDLGDVNMARHAAALLGSTNQHPYLAFQAARGEATEKRFRWLAFGPLAHGARDRDLPRSVEWLVELPTMMGVAMGAPNRILRFPFLKSELSRPATLARRYLERYPNGEYAGEVREWLIDYERDRGNHVGALTLIESAPEPDPDLIEKVRPKAAEQALVASQREKQRDVRQRLLREVAQRFQDTEAGAQAGLALREELEQASAQRIRISRGFLEEHPEVAGPDGLALVPGLIDGQALNGELHPEGITLLGGRWVELSFLDESGRDGDPPERVRRRVSEERIARLVAQLEESSRELALTDPDVNHEHDADRDAFFERARLGAIDDIDVRPHAQSSYTFMGAREKYGMVRSRESILPVEIVLQGSFEDFGLGAFPRIRMPKSTPDAFLFDD